jgi:hypothetical protein
MKQRFVIGSIGAALVAISMSSAPVAAQGQRQGAAAGGRQENATSVATPKRPNGVPDFSGIWVQTGGAGFGAGGGAGAGAGAGGPQAGLNRETGNFNTVLRNRTTNPVDFERDSGIRQRMYPREARPWYKPEYWERVRFNDLHGHSLEAPDPDFQCMPAGVPRIGMPQEIMQDDKHMVFLYPLHTRRIYIDGRPQLPESEWIGTWFGRSIGTWEGDTLVISTVDFNGLEWLGWPGWFTSPDKKVTERMRRVGNTLTWQATVEDPSILLRPWTMEMQRRQLNTDPRAEIQEPLPCVEKDLGHIVTKERG